jgi:hypothetical protein
VAASPGPSTLAPRLVVVLCATVGRVGGRPAPSWATSHGLSRDSLAALLTRAELQITTQWQAREYTTDPPRYTPYTVWSLECRVGCDTPIRVAHLLRIKDVVRWGLDGEGTAVSVVGRFQPADWMHSDAVHVGFGRASA